MKKNPNYKTRNDLIDEIKELRKIDKRQERLHKDNKNLRDNLSRISGEYYNLLHENKDLKESIKSLKELNDELRDNYDDSIIGQELQKEIDRLGQENLSLSEQIETKKEHINIISEQAVCLSRIVNEYHRLVGLLGKVFATKDVSNE